MASNEGHVSYLCDLCSVGATKPLAGRGKARRWWGRAGGLCGRGAWDGARDSIIPGQDRPPPPCKWLEVEKGLLQAPGDKLGGLLCPPPSEGSAALARWDADLLQPTYGRWNRAKGAVTEMRSAKGGDGSCLEFDGHTGASAYPGAGAGRGEAVCSSLCWTFESILCLCCSLDVL